MRQLAIGILVFILGLISPIILERFLKNAPEWVGRILPLIGIVIGIIIAILSEPIYSKLKNPRNHPICSILIVAISTALIITGIWWFIVIPIHEKKSYEVENSKIIITARELNLVPPVGDTFDQNLIIKLSFFNGTPQDCVIENFQIQILTQLYEVTKLQEEKIINNNDDLLNNYNNKLKDSATYLITSPLQKEISIILKSNQLYPLDYKIPVEYLRRHLSRELLKQIYRYPMGIVVTIVDYKGGSNFISIFPFAEIEFNRKGGVDYEFSPKSIEYPFKSGNEKILESHFNLN